MLNLFGNGLIGRVNVIWDSVWTESDPGIWEYVYNRRDERNYYLKDHLACPPKLQRRRRSIRLTVNESGNIISAQDYYPYGEILRSYTTGANVNDKYKFTEKERDIETGYDYFPPGRTYDSKLVRWLQVDPLADKYPGWSLYNYALNNPLRYIDPKGMEAVNATPDDPDDKKKKQQESTFQYLEKVGDFLEMGFEIISNGVSTSINQGSQVLKQGSEVVAQSILTNGPGILNNLSDGVAVLGISVGTGFLSAGQVEIGGPILLGSLDLSTKLDVAATGLAALNYAINGDSKKVQYQMYRLAAGGAFGKVFGKVVTTIKSFSPIYSPLIF